MPKTFKKFRDEWYDEWDVGDDDFRKKDNRLKDRRDQRRKKVSEKNSKFDETGDE
jgi:hypothetical protein